MKQNLSDYFASEAGEYLELMERALSGGAADPSRLLRLARGVRGSAQVAGAAAIAAVAERLEWAMRAAADQTGGLDPELGQRALDTVRGLRELVAAHGSWGREEDARARELAEAWNDAAPPRRQTATGDGLLPFVARELIGVVAALDRAREPLAAAPAESAPLREVLRQTRALRGVTGARPLAPVLEVLEALEAYTAALAEGGTEIGDEGLEMVAAAREALAAAGKRAASGELPSVDDPEQTRFRELRLSVLGSDAADDPRGAVPVEELFEGNGVHVLSSPVAPASDAAGGTTYAAFVRGESERQLDRVGSGLPEEGGVDAQRAALLDAVLGVRGLAASYGFTELTEAAGRAAARLQLAPSAADARAALEELRGELPPQAEPTDESESTEAAGGLSSAAGVEEEAVPMEDLLLRGDRALEAALELRDRALAAAGDEETRLLLVELFELLELARTQESVI